MAKCVHSDFDVELANVFTAPSETHEAIDDALRSSLAITTNYKRTTRTSKADGR